MLDASGLEAAIIIVDGQIDEQSTAQIEDPHKHSSHQQQGRWQVKLEIDAPERSEIHGGNVMVAKGSRSDNGSQVTITGPHGGVQGDITGTDTRVPSRSRATRG